MLQPRPSFSAMPAPAPFRLAGAALHLLPDGALWWAAERTLVVADLHLEKGSSFALRGMMLPPYDTGATLARLAALVERLTPDRVIALGDSFHDRHGAGRLEGDNLSALRRLTSAAEWIWIAGNHDPDPPSGVGGWATSELAIGPLHFRHEPRVGGAQGEIAGHLHPAARVGGRGRTLRRRCFAADPHRLVLPAFGAYAGGLNVLDQAFSRLFRGRAFHAWVCGEETVHPVSAARLLSG